MAFLDSLNISGSALTAQMMRLNIISENIANQDVTRTEGGGAYRRKMVVFETIPYTAERRSFRNLFLQAQGRMPETGGGVKVSRIVEDQRPLKMVYNPNHPDANEQGYVEMPNVDMLKETLDSMEASRAFEANLTALNATKTMALKALEIGK